MARDHGFGCVQQMQGQMHVHVTELDPPVPLGGHFFRRLHTPLCRHPAHSFAERSPESLASFRLCNRTSTARSVLVADCGP
ncbi:hypothetical protein DN051_18260 [Streptomyces cadmiisoli]|uniref:Uncharacterized protein n=1 Tax=Streptomyces cadmiisoli TaxID=2184053 RepID=A0A2Z4IZX2_9ACTN|nr:hypothetical protein DN051_18260 [Streptomyces cadmiisoli]